MTSAIKRPNELYFLVDNLGESNGVARWVTRRFSVLDG